MYGEKMKMVKVVLFHQNSAMIAKDVEVEAFDALYAVQGAADEHLRPVFGFTPVRAVCEGHEYEIRPILTFAVEKKS